MRGSRDYTKGKIYRLCYGIFTVYIGSSIMPLIKRLWLHRSTARHGTSKLYEFMRAHGIHNFRIVLIEAWPCTKKEELTQREQHWIEHSAQIFPNVELKNMLNAWVSPELRRAREIADCARGNRTVKGKARKVRYQNSEKGKLSLMRKRQPFLCECGRTITFNKRFSHTRTIVHNSRL